MKRFAGWIILNILLVFILSSMSGVRLAKAGTIVVPDDYASIQQAIDFASPGDTVFVRRGTYRENLFIGKALTLIGEDPQKTVIDGGGVGHVIYVKANFVKVSGFTIKNSSSEYPYSGVYLDESHNCQIYNNYITREWDWDDRYCYGIYLYNSSDNQVYQNYIFYRTGIQIAWSRNNTIRNNYIFRSKNGINLAMSRNNIIEENTFNSTGIFVNADYNSNYNTFSRNNIINSYWGFYIKDSVGSLILGNTIDAGTCIYLYNANNTVIIENDFYVSWDAALYGSYAYNIIFFHNNIFSDYIELSYTGGNVWDDGYPSGGNYWKHQQDKADYYKGPNQDEPGSDGIVDKPYKIDWYNIDRYPFMNPYRPPKFEISCSPSSITLYAPQSKSCSIIITSVNSFILPVNISGSWFGQAPNGVVFSLSKSTITPPPNGKDTSNLTVTSSSTAVAGAYTLRITGTSGSLTNYVDIVVTVLSASLDITPPEIGEPAQTPTNTIIQPTEKVKISVNVTDIESGISQVILSYTTNDGTTWTNLNMQLNTTTGSYEIEMPQQQPGTIVKYKIIAYDNAGNNATKDNNGYYYTYHVIPEFPPTVALALFLLTTLIATVTSKNKRKTLIP